MTPLALGLVETFGLVPAIEAADTAVKTADVCLTGLECIGAGLVTVKIHGDISAVKAGVEAAAEAARRLGQVCSQTVIGRTAEGLSRLVPPPDKDDPLDEQPEAPGTKRQGTPHNQAPIPTAAKDARASQPSEAPMAPTVRQGTAHLAKMRVVALRKLARTLAQDYQDFPLSSEKIKYARKKELIRIISSYATAPK